MEKASIIMLLLVLSTFIISVYFYPEMPEKMASHWNARGEVDGYMSRFWGTFLIPLVILGLFGLFLVLPKIDPLKANYPAFKKYYYGVVIFVLIFMLYIHIVSIIANLGYLFNMSYIILFPMAILFLFLGYTMPNIKRNWFMGIRTPWTLSSDKVWKKTHKIGGILFMVYGIFLLVILLFYNLVVEHFLWIILGPIIILVAFTLVYSYYEYREEENKK